MTKFTSTSMSALSLSLAAAVWVVALGGVAAESSRPLAPQESRSATDTGYEIPFVAWATGDVDDYFQYPATLLGSSGAESTYGVPCLNPSTSLCFGDEGWTSMTLISSPKTMEIIFQDDNNYLTTGCTLTGTPFPTTGTCSETSTAGAANGTAATSSTTVYTVPYTTTATLAIGGGSVWFSEDIYTATVDVAAVETGSSTTSSASTRKGSGTAATQTSSGNAVKSTGAGASGTGTASHNAARAMITAAPKKWMGMVVAGAVAGVAAVGV